MYSFQSIVKFYVEVSVGCYSLTIGTSYFTTAYLGMRSFQKISNFLIGKVLVKLDFLLTLH